MMENTRIGVIGLGYVGLPLAVTFGKLFPVVGFDVNQERVRELARGHDRTREIDEAALDAAEKLECTTDPSALAPCNYYIVTVPTPIDDHNIPDLKPLRAASVTVGRVLKKGDIVIYESTVYPGCTEEECVPLLEKESGLAYNQDFFCGYSPERINPGDKEHTLTKIKKVVSGSTPETAAKVNALYSRVITAGTHLASSLKVAEAAKAIENAQRDINIAFINELALIFHRLNIDTHEVLEAAGTKWNFLPFMPGLVGGHCIGVDPYYLTYKAEALGYHPLVILAGRRINDGMGSYVAGQVIKLMIKKGHRVEGARVLILGVTFKENCPDIRNSRVIDIVKELSEYGCRVEVHDPLADKEEVKREYGFELLSEINGSYDAIVFCVAHGAYADFPFTRFAKDKTVIYDVKGFIAREVVSGRL